MVDELKDFVLPMVYSLSEFSPVIAITDKQNPHTTTHDVTRNTARPICRRTCLLFEKLLCTAGIRTEFSRAADRGKLDIRCDSAHDHQWSLTLPYRDTSFPTIIPILLCQLFKVPPRILVGQFVAEQPMRLRSRRESSIFGLSASSRRIDVNGQGREERRYSESDADERRRLHEPRHGRA